MKETRSEAQILQNENLILDLHKKTERARAIEEAGQKMVKEGEEMLSKVHEEVLENLDVLSQIANNLRIKELIERIKIEKNNGDTSEEHYARVDELFNLMDKLPDKQ